ncbi:MAG: glycosyltransferase family 4 protein [Thermoanaerobaculia bacterium]
MASVRWILAAAGPVRNLRYLADLARWAVRTAAACRRRHRETRPGVAVDVSPFWEPLTGIGWYLYRMLEELAGRDDLVFRLYGPDLVHVPVQVPGTPGPLIEPPAGPALERVAHRLPPHRGAGLGLLVDRAARLLAPALLALDGNAVLFAPNYFPHRRFEIALALGTPLVATVHDLSYRKVPWAVRPETLDELGRHLDFVWIRAALVLTDAEAVRREILEAGLTSPERVRAIHLAPAHAGLVEESGPGTLPSGVPEGAGLFVGTVEPRKNLETLLEAWRRLRERPGLRGGAPPPLVVCGRIGWAGRDLLRELERARREGWLVHLDYVADRELASLYRSARVVALPSWYEGFALPALEACAAGAPVVASDLPVLREVLGEAARFAPPDRPDRWVRELGRVLDDETLRAELALRGRARAGHFDWTRTARATAEALLEVAEWA